MPLLLPLISLYLRFSFTCYLSPNGIFGWGAAKKNYISLAIECSPIREICLHWDCIWPRRRRQRQRRRRPTIEFFQSEQATTTTIITIIIFISCSKYRTQFVSLRLRCGVSSVIYLFSWKMRNISHSSFFRLLYSGCERRTHFVPSLHNGSEHVSCWMNGHWTVIVRCTKPNISISA